MKIRLLVGALLLGLIAAPTLTLAQPAPTVPLPAGMKLLFDGKTLDGWVQEPLNATTFSGGDIKDLPALARKLSAKSDPVSAFLSDQLDEPAKAALIANSPTNDNSKDLKSALAKTLSRIVAGPSLYEDSRFKNVALRAETTGLLKSNPQGRDLLRLNRVLIEDAYPNEIGASPSVAWTVKNGVMASLGAGRGVIHTKDSFDRHRIIFDVRHVSGKPDHRAGVLVFCTAPVAGEKALDALGGIQFQVPNGGSWDYRKGKNNNGKGLFTRVLNPNLDEHQWSRVEILVDPASGTARMAVAQPVGSKAVEVLNFKDSTAGQKGPFALQMHNAGLFDEFANIAIELDPKGDELITMK